MKMNMEVYRVMSEADNFLETARANRRLVDETGDWYPVESLPVSEELRHEIMEHIGREPVRVEVWRAYHTEKKEIWVVVKNEEER